MADITLGTVRFLGRNILHNWDWRAPVNQRGVSGAITTGTYFYDRWIRNSGTVTTNGSYLTIAAWAVVEQRIEGNLLASQVVTVTVMVGGLTFSGTGTMPGSGTASVTITGWGTATLGYATGYTYLRLSPTAASNVQAVKMELGTISTLHLDPPADYGVELAKCLRYFYAINSDKSAWKTFCLGHSASSWNMYAYIWLLETMRIRPTVYWGGTISLSAGGITGTYVTAISVDSGTSGDYNPHTLGLYVTHGGYVLTDHQTLRLNAYNDTNAYINLSADL